ncbi:MAG: 2-methylcitrate dehydratase [Streptosporangiales bacterium]|nr:2-methylcitrate dehydratase [Streptosporangiales bacterium]
MPAPGELAAAVRALGAFTAEFDLDSAREDVRRAGDLVVLDTVGVIIAGARTDELRALLEVLDPPAGPAPLLGTGRAAAAETAALVNGTAACALELDEGNKHARAHPAAHVLPAALAVGAAADASGAAVLSAFLAGHEVASRFGRATRLAPGVHPHGHTGATGAAAACARLLGLNGDGIAAAIDAAAGLALAPPFESALAGSFVRNTWTGVAGANGVLAARLAAAGLAAVDATAAASLGGILGSLDAGALTEDLGTRFDVTLGYLKRHASCSFTHPAVDAALELAAREPGLHHRRVREVRVDTHGPAARLDRTDPPTRLAAMFSIPHTVAAALVRGAVDPAATGPQARSDPQVRRIAAATTVRHVPELDERAPAERPARVTIRLDDGSEHSHEVPNPVGDADYHPLGWDGVRAKLHDLLGAGHADRTERVLAGLAGAPSVRPLLADLP